MKRALLLALASLPTGCNLLLDIGEHHLQSDADGNATSTSVGAGGEAGPLIPPSSPAFRGVRCVTYLIQGTQVQTTKRTAA